jgi:hypothetical protein
MTLAEQDQMARELDDVRKRVAMLEKDVAKITAKAPVFIRASMSGAFINGGMATVHTLSDAKPKLPIDDATKSA